MSRHSSKDDLKLNHGLICSRKYAKIIKFQITFVLRENINFVKFFLCESFLKSLLNLLQYCFCYVFLYLAMRHVGSQLPHQGLNSQPLHWKVKSQTLDI